MNTLHKIGMRFTGTLLSRFAHLRTTCAITILSMAGAVSPCIAEGDPTVSEAPLIGTLYDFKQGWDFKEIHMDSEIYDKTLCEFITKGWDEQILSKYLRLGQPFYSNHIFIPMIGDKNAPKALGVDKKIKDGYWVIHYKAQVVPPADGRYRFAGYAHATLFMAVNGKLVLNGCRWDVTKTMPNFPWRSDVPQGGAKAGDHKLAIGSWVDLKASEPIDIDILMGNRVATELCAFLLVEKEGETYAKDENGFPILPLFQLSRFNGELPQGKMSTNTVVNVMVWKSLQ